MREGDPVALLEELVAFGKQFHQRAPIDLIETARNLVVELQAWGVPLPAQRPPVETPEPPPAPAAAKIVPLHVDRDGATTRVTARSAEAEPVARVFQRIVDLLAQKPLGSMASAALEFAAHIEVLELENAELRARLNGEKG